MDNNIVLENIKKFYSNKRFYETNIDTYLDNDKGVIIVKYKDISLSPLSTKIVRIYQDDKCISKCNAFDRYTKFLCDELKFFDMLDYIICPKCSDEIKQDITDWFNNCKDSEENFMDDFIKALMKINEKQNFFRLTYDHSSSLILFVINDWMSDLKLAKFRTKKLSEILNEMLREKKKGAPDIYNKTPDSPSTINRILNGETEKPSTITILKIAIVLECSLEETITLLHSAGRHTCQLQELRILKFIIDKNYDTFEIDTELYDCGFTPIFSKK